MATKRVYVMFNESQVSKLEVMQAIKDEGYEFAFMYGTGELTHCEIEGISLADEIWVWGDCSCLNEYKFATSAGKDIWVMG